MAARGKAPSKRDCVTCGASTAGGGTCRRRTCKYGPQCWQHTRKNFGVTVKRSTIRGAGLGLFAYKSFNAGDNIVRYTGKKKTRARLDEQYPGDTLAPYAVALSTDPAHVIDSRKTSSGVARYANDAGYRPNSNRYHRNRNNAEFDENDDGVIMIKAKRNIPRGSEIFVEYGPEYWNLQPDNN